jgi:integrase/recombinase XerD
MGLMMEAAVSYRHPCDENRAPFTCKMPKAARNRALLLVLLDTGVRLGELTRLRVRDVDLEKPSITVRPYRSSKKSRPRVIPLGKAAVKTLWKYIAEEVREEEDLLFSLSASGVQSMLKRLGERTGVENVHPHRFRHTFAIEFLRNQGDIYTLKYILGHSTLEMVEHYLHIASMDKLEAHKRASPVDHWFGRQWRDGHLADLTYSGRFVTNRPFSFGNKYYNLGYNQCSLQL